MEACLANLATIDLTKLNGKAIRELDKLLGSYSVFRKTYCNNLAGFVRDCIKFSDGEGMTAYQEEALTDLPSAKRLAIRGPHGLGKTALGAWIVLGFALTRDVDSDWKVITTASAWRQLKHYLWPEIHKWVRRLDWQKIGRPPFNQTRELLTQSINLSTGRAFAVASNDHNTVEGAHASGETIDGVYRPGGLLYLFDEAKAIPDATWDAAEGAFAAPDIDDVWSLAISTPGTSFGRFFDIHSHKPGYEDWTARHVTLEEAIAAGRISRAWADQRKLQWGAKSDLFKARVLGEFMSGDAEGIIPLAWVEAANDRWRDWQEAGFPGRVTAIGVDVGGGLVTGDKTTIAIVVDGVRVLEVRKHDRAADPAVAMMEVAGLVAGIIRNRGGVAYVDATGIGLGVLHRLVEMGIPARSFIAAKKTELLDRSGDMGFGNWRAAAWWVTGELLDPKGGMDVCLPKNDDLTGELVALGVKRYTSASKMILESKEDVIKRLHRSTDSGDSVVQGLVGPILCLEEDGRVGGERHRLIDQRVRIGADY